MCQVQYNAGSQGAVYEVMSIHPCAITSIALVARVQMTTMTFEVLLVAIGPIVLALTGLSNPGYEGNTLLHQPAPLGLA